MRYYSNIIVITDGGISPLRPVATGMNVREGMPFSFICNKYVEGDVILLANKQDVEDLILIINRQLDIEYCNNSGISNNSEFLREINLFTYIKQFETGIFRNGKYEILIDDAMLAWGLYYIVKVRVKG